MNGSKSIGRIGIATILLMSSLTVMVGNAITPAVPEIGKVFGLGNYASWLVTAPALGVVVSAIPAGKLIDRLGPYRVGVTCLLLYGILGPVGAVMPNIYLMFLDRFLLGAATAGVMSSSITLIAGFFQGEKQLKILAMQGMAMEFGGVVFLAVSGVLSEISWKMPFGIYILGIAAFAMMIGFIPYQGPVSENHNRSEEKKPAGGVPLPLVFLSAFLGMLMFFTAMVSLPLYLQNMLGYSPMFTGNYLAALDLVSVGAAGFMPKIVGKIKESGCILCAFLFYGTAYLLYSFFDSMPVLIAAMVCVGIGVGLSTPLFNSIVVNKSAPEKKGINASINTMAMFTGQFLSAVLVSFLIGQKVYMAASLISFAVVIAIIPITSYYRRKPV